MKKYSLIISAAALLFCAACAKEEPASNAVSANPIQIAVKPGNNFIVSASFGDDGTRTYLAEDGLQPLWDIGDEIAVLNMGSKQKEIVVIKYVVDEEGQIIEYIDETGKRIKCKPDNVPMGGEDPFAAFITKDHTICTFFAGTGPAAPDVYFVYPASSLKDSTGIDGNPVIEVPSVTDGSFKNANICAGYIPVGDWPNIGESIEELHATIYTKKTTFSNVVSILRITDKTKSIEKFTVGQPGIPICGHYQAKTGERMQTYYKVELDGMHNPEFCSDKITVTGMNSSGPYYVALHPCTMKKGPIAKYYTYELADETKPDYTKSLTADTELKKNTIYRIGFALPDDDCRGVFSVSDSIAGEPGKKVSFAKGNLGAIVMNDEFSNFVFANAQYDYYGATSANIGDAVGVMDLFGWSTDGATATSGYKPWGISRSNTDTDYYGNFVDWGSNSKLVSDLGSGWETLTADEWTWLLGRPIGNTVDADDLIPGVTCRKSSTIWLDQNSNGKIEPYERSGNDTDNARFVKIRICTDSEAGKYVYGLLIFPDIIKWTEKMGLVPYGINDIQLLWTAVDSKNTYTKTEFAAMENAGCVFLPAAGYRNANTVSQANSVGYYWTSQTDLYPSYKYCYQVGFDGKSSGSFVYVNKVPRKAGRSVRLAHE